MEKRLSPYIPSPSLPIMQRISRAFEHRLYLIDKRFIGDPRSPSCCEFFVLGSTGNVYTVKLDLLPSCTCPDSARPCKHILFVMLRVVKLPPTDPRAWQTALLSSELHDMLFRVLSIDEGVLASQLVRERFKELVGGDGEDGKPVQRELDGDCRICYERMAGEDGKPVEAVVFCKMCGNNVHKECFTRWSKRRGRGRATCIYCRAAWGDDKKGKKPEEDEVGEGGYLNLASCSGEHHAEATSLVARYPNSHRAVGRRRRRARRS